VKIAISGASGFIGRKLMETLVSDGHAVHALSRHARMNMPAGVRVFQWDPEAGEPPAEGLRDVAAVIHLAGEPVAQRWNAKVKARIRGSRVAGTANLVAAIARLPRKPEVLVCSSAIGFYGSRGDEILTEESTQGEGFLAEVCAGWEWSAALAEAAGVRVVSIRTGHVLHSRGGLLSRVLPTFRAGLGGRLGDGKQWMSWIHLDDLVGLFGFAIANPVSGVLNGVAPHPVTNMEFTRALALALHRPAILPVPRLALRLMFGEMSEVILSSQRVLPERAQAEGFAFRYAELSPALASLLWAH
jgi:uncharacterized protein (TIGR01777 family)